MSKEVIKTGKFDRGEKTAVLERQFVMKIMMIKESRNLRGGKMLKPVYLRLFHTTIHRVPSKTH